MLSEPYKSILIFYNDDTNEKLASYTLKKSAEGIDINVNLTDVKFLRIEFDAYTDVCALVNARL